MNIPSVLRLLAFIIFVVALLMAIPALLAVIYGEMTSFWSFIITISLMIFLGLVIIVATQARHKRINITQKDSYITVTVTWLLISAFGALPLYLSRTLPNYSMSFFEIMSGFTTTGATTINDIEAQDLSILFWRNMTNWLGGMGIVVLFVAVLPALGVRGTALVGAESVGPTKDKLTPQIQRTAMALWLIYLGLSILEVIFLLFGGLSLYDAVTVTFGTMGAAGFAPKNASIAAFNSPYVEWVCIIFMFFAGTNFALYFKILQRKFKRFIHDGEFRIYLSVILIASLLVSINLFLSGVFTLSSSIRNAFFQVVSFITTTGFTSTNYSTWPFFSQSILLLLCFVGGCAGSAGGGIKVIRIAVMAKVGGNSIKTRLHQNAATNIKIGDDIITNETASSIAGFVGLYLITVFVSTVIISLTNYDLILCLSSVLLTIGNIGIGFGSIGTTQTFSIYPSWALWIFSFLMMVGRLELFTVYSLFTRSLWRK